MENNKDTYFVAVKVFLCDGAGKLFITKDRFGDWDLPGGRLRPEDFATPLPEVVARKIKEELGDAVQYELGEPMVFMRHERDEVLSSGDRAQRRIFALGYQARYLGGELQLGKNHGQSEWVELKTWIPENYFSGGWLAGVKEFQAKFLKQI